MQQFDVVIVGAGHGGSQTAIFLRQMGFEGSIVLIGDEPEFPYERPPLSKELLSGEKPFERTLIRPTAFWAQREITMMLGRRVTDINPSMKQVVASGEVIGYRWLVWAAGARPRPLPCTGAASENIHFVRSKAHVDAIKGQITGVNHVTVIGGGYIGLEAAAILTKLGKRVSLIEANNRVLSRVAGVQLSRFFEDEHRRHGVDLRTSSSVRQIETVGNLATGIVLEDGERLSTDMVIVGIGVIPEVEPLQQAGASVENGVIVDAQCRSSLNDVFALGDCASHRNKYAGNRLIRLESVQNANDQAKVVASTIVGKTEVYDAMPWFWSNQYELKLQTAGLSAGHDSTVVRGDPVRRSFSILYFIEDRLIAIDCVNAVKDFVQARTRIAAFDRFNPKDLVDTAVPLKDIAAL